MMIAAAIHKKRKKKGVFCSLIFGASRIVGIVLRPIMAKVSLQEVADKLRLPNGRRSIGGRCIGSISHIDPLKSYTKRDRRSKYHRICMRRCSKSNQTCTLHYPLGRFARIPLSRRPLFPMTLCPGSHLQALLRHLPTPAQEHRYTGQTSCSHNAP